MPHTHFCKRKKEKKESRLALWRVSKKQVFRVKYYPNASVETLSGCGGFENEGGDFIRNRRLELAFLNTRNKPLASFLSFFFVKMFTPNVLVNWGFKGVQSGLVNKGVFLFAYVVYRVLMQIKIHSCSGLIFEDA